MREQRKLTSHGRNLETGDTRTDGHHTRNRRKLRPKYCTFSQYSWGQKNLDKEWITDESQNLSVELLVSGYNKQYLFRGGAKYLLLWGQGPVVKEGGWDRAVQIINEPGGLLWLLCRILSSPSPPLPPFQFIGLHLHAVPWKLPSLCDWNLRRPWRLKKSGDSVGSKG